MTTIIDMEGAGSEWLWRPGEHIAFSAWKACSVLNVRTVTVALASVDSISGLNTYLSLANLLQEHYPGIVKKLIVVNGQNLTSIETVDVLFA